MLYIKNYGVKSGEFFIAILNKPVKSQKNEKNGVRRPA